MVGINWNPAWQLEPPARIDFNHDGSVAFKGPVGNVLLPEEYKNFLLKSDGAALRDRGSWFLAHFPAGVSIEEVEWLGGLESNKNMTWGFYPYPQAEKNFLPPGFIGIGYAPGHQDNYILLATDPKSQDFGKVFIWARANDPWVTGDNTRGLGYVADNFAEFMNNLTEKKNL